MEGEFDLFGLDCSSHVDARLPGCDTYYDSYTGGRFVWVDHYLIAKCKMVLLVPSNPPKKQQIFFRNFCPSLLK